MTSINRFLASQSQYFRECLDARVEFEKSVIWGDTEESVEYSLEAFRIARDAGYNAFRIGIDQENVPDLLKRDKYLAGWWKEGWDAADDMAEMNECHGCNDGTGNPCHIHG